MHKEIIIPIYDAKVVLFVKATTEECVKSLKELYGIEEEVFECKGFVNSNYSKIIKRKIFYIYIKSTKNISEYMDTISHELFHLTQEILEDRGEYFKKKTANESYAYLQGYLMGQNFDFWNKAFNKFKKLK